MSLHGGKSGLHGLRQRFWWRPSLLLLINKRILVSKGEPSFVNSEIVLVLGTTLTEGKLIKLTSSLRNDNNNFNGKGLVFTVLCVRFLVNLSTY